MSYQHSAPFYDLFADESDVRYFLELGLKYKSALEIGVGTARVALELARAGVEVWGIDNSLNMLREARKKLEKESKSVQNKVTLIEADMKDFSLAKEFPFVYIPASTIQHCPGSEDQISCLQAINRHMPKNGLLAFNLILPSSAYNSNLRLVGKVRHNDAMVMRFISCQPNWQEQLLEVLLIFEIYKKGKMTDRICEASTISMISKREMLLLLKETGFSVQRVFGNYDKSDKITNQVVIEARKVK